MVRKSYVSQKKVHNGSLYRSEWIDFFNSLGLCIQSLSYRVYTKREPMIRLTGSNIAFVRSYLRLHQAAGQVDIFIFLVKFSIYANKFCDAGQVHILTYFEA